MDDNIIRILSVSLSPGVVGINATLKDKDSSYVHNCTDFESNESLIARMIVDNKIRLIKL
jgi:hypothetical protein